MKKLITYIIRQQVTLINYSKEWIDVTTTTIENEARISYKKARKNAKLFGFDVNDIALIKITEEIIEEI